MRKTLGEGIQAGTARHGRGDADQLIVLRRHIAQPVAENLGIGHLADRSRLDAFSRIELARAVIQHRIGLRQLVALALLGHHVQELRALQVLQVLQGWNQRFQVVAVDRADIVETEFFKHGGRHHHAFGMFFNALGQLPHRRRQYRLADILGLRIELARHQTRQITVQGSYRRRDRHVVIVQDHQHVDVVVDTGVIHRFEYHAGGHGAIADHGNRVAIGLAFGLGGQSHPQRSRNRGRRMGCAEGVVLAFATARESRDAVKLAQRVHALAAAGENLVRVSLMTDVPDDPVLWRIEDVMQGDRQFDRAQVGRQMAAGLRHRLDDEFAQFIGQRLELRPRQLAQICRTVDCVEYFHMR